jgi:hypothetical protein
VPKPQCQTEISNMVAAHPVETHPVSTAAKVCEIVSPSNNLFPLEHRRALRQTTRCRRAYLPVFRRLARDSYKPAGDAQGCIFDRYRDRYQYGNRRTIQHLADAKGLVSGRNDTWRPPAHFVPSDSGPGDRSRSTSPRPLIFESYRNRF